ncbi:MAG: Eco57I restriction-modification methylase domain-containing protein [Deltaproteobacteria bacterium]|nr:Eco57I restriction-modification methylase domain-containing protein [Deltaproteobacteria bacterium]
MDAKQLVRDTLQNSFDKERFIYFVKNLLNAIDESKAFHARGYVPEIFKDYVKTYERLGTYTDPEEKRVDILVVYLQKESTLDRARTAQRNFIARYLKDRGEKDAGLIAFVSPNKEEWRFSFVKMEYKLTETPKGTVKAKEEFTPARRYSFLVGCNESSHTAQRQLFPILSDDKVNPTINDLEDTFHIEKVTKEFFEKYRELFLGLKESLDELVKRDSKIRQDFKSKSINTVDFAKKLLGQIVFLYFLQKKGWFGVERDKDWGTGPKNFLRQLFEKKIANYDNFFNDILEPLFYEALAVERSDNFYSRFNCKIPFLNGGLFDPINNYDWVHTDIIMPDELFSNNIKTKEGDIGTGILDVFDRYNFTVKEDEPLEKEVAVDPEMLGKVFENLLEVKDRKSKGTYYTPREIVHYMCQESLTNYLATELEGKVNKEDIETLIKFGETAVEHDSRVINEGRETSKYSFKLPENVRKHAELIDEKLASIRVCDPAVGSGAFLVGMMNDVVRTRNALTSYIKGKNGRTIYDFKRHAIQNCLYGVDIDLSAVEIAKLRLWLSLIVDEEDIKRIKPLPNLDYKIVQGNSLLSVEKNLFNLDLFNKLEELKPLFFNETNIRKKQEYKNQIDKLISQITNGRKDFDFEVYFSEVFHEKKGFDVLIENPPYVRVDDLETSLKLKYKNIYKTAIGKYDLYYLFFEKSFLISNPKGVCVFISPNKFCAADSALTLRATLFKCIKSGEIISTSRIRVFSEASNYPIISILSKNKSASASFFIRQVEELTQLENKYSINRYYSANHADFELLPTQVIPINISQSTFNLLRRLYGKGGMISEYISVSEGLRIPSKLESEVPEDLRIVKQYQFSKYSRIKQGSFIRKAKLKKVISDSSNRYQKIFSPKILIAEDALQINATLDLEEFVPQGGVYFATSKNKNLSIKFLLGLLNSRLLSYLYEALYAGMHMGGGYLRYRSKFLENLPLPYKVSTSITNQIDGMVDKIFAIAKDDDYLENYPKQAKVKEYECQINQMVYKLYGLTNEETKIVEGFDI